MGPQDGPSISSTESAALRPDLDAAIVAYIRGVGSALAGHHPERVPDPQLLARVEVVLARLDAIQPDEMARDHSARADTQACAVAAA